MPATATVLLAVLLMFFGVSLPIVALATALAAAYNRYGV